MPSHILDASAVIALMNKEPGATRVRDLIRLGSAGISTVNISEVATKLVARGAPAPAAEAVHGSSLPDPDPQPPLPRNHSVPMPKRWFL